MFACGVATETKQELRSVESIKRNYSLHMNIQRIFLGAYNKIRRHPRLQCQRNRGPHGPIEV